MVGQLPKCHSLVVAFYAPSKICFTVVPCCITRLKTTLLVEVYNSSDINA